MSEDLVHTMAALATTLAEEAAEIAREGLGRISIEWKADNSVVTETDHAIQAHILSAISRRYPDHAVWAEETVPNPKAHADRTTARYCWVIDPLDGTRNFAVRFPCYATSISVLDRGHPVVGVVREHNIGQLLVAMRGLGTTRNGEPMRIEAWPTGVELLVGTPSSHDTLTQRVVTHWTATDGLILRNLGSTAFQLALVAGGSLGAAFCKRCKIWDVAAGALLVTEAGGIITDPFGAAYTPFDMESDSDADKPFLASSPDVHDRLLESIRSVAGATETH